MMSRAEKDAEERRNHRNRVAATILIRIAPEWCAMYAVGKTPDEQIGAVNQCVEMAHAMAARNEWCADRSEHEIH